MADVDVVWTGASFCEASSCAEWAAVPGGVLLRSSNDPGRTILLTGAEFAVLVRAAREGEIVVGEE